MAASVLGQHPSDQAAPDPGPLMSVESVLLKVALVPLILVVPVTSGRVPSAPDLGVLTHVPSVPDPEAIARVPSALEDPGLEQQGLERSDLAVHVRIGSG